MASLKEIVYDEVSKYAEPGVDDVAYLAHNADCSLLMVAHVAHQGDMRFSQLGLLVRILGDQVVIEEDRNNKILADALQARGISRSQIILAYAGEASDSH
jgi:hypothetical protein